MSIELYECRACGEWFDLEEPARFEACPYCGGNFIQKRTGGVSNEPGEPSAFSISDGCGGPADSAFT